jgi:hypothetical protein
LDCFFWVTVLSVTVELVAGAGSHQTVGVGVLDWVFCFPGLDACLAGGGLGLVFLPVF